MSRSNAKKTGADPILDALNEPQREAVINMKGPSLILAGAGSGKTKALTHRIAYMISRDVEPWQILAVTFTNKAAAEMKERIKNLLEITQGTENVPFGERAGRMPVMGTFHSICARILRRDIDKLGRDRNFIIYDTDDQEKLMKEVLREMHIDEKELKPRAVLGYIGRFKSEAISPKAAQPQATTARMHHVITAYVRYQNALKAANALDFDDIILETVRLFQEVPAVLDRYQETWRFLHVDEYQDTNHAQYLFISLLAQKYRNLCVIGDPDQSIYAFRGADIRNIMEFEHEYPDAVRIKLEQNYRSTQVVLTAANGVIKANPNRPEKEMWSSRKEGPNVIIQEVRDERGEASEAVKAAEQLKSEGIPFNEQVILYRTNAQSRLFEEACMRRGVPYRIVGGVKFYARKEVKDVMAYLHVFLNPLDTVALLRIINVPSRKIGQTSIGHLQAYASAQRTSLWNTLKATDDIPELNGGVKERMKNFCALIERFADMTRTHTVSLLMQRLLEDVGMERWLKDDSEEGEDRWQNVQELLSVTHKYDHLDPLTSLTSFLEEVALVSEVDKLTDVKDDALTLMTLHLCKGLEFEHVMVTGCEEGIFPHASSAFEKEQLEEERRLMYVGMTRAKTHLRLLLARSRMLYGETHTNAPSRFLDDLPPQVIERRSDELLSAFAWATESGRMKAATMTSKGKWKVEPYRQQEVAIEFNQDTVGEDVNQDAFGEGTRVCHPAFGEGKIVRKSGDVVTILFDSGKRKDFALSIAPLTIVG
ncbi:MAG: UvrD-helicase domain-containing protein [Candidatus Peribacteraceae bacterium]|nr:UvrD-helicase domain-containing protein [Candidatus Peribacteraceae bacterium]